MEDKEVTEYKDSQTEKPATDDWWFRRGGTYESALPALFYWNSLSNYYIGRRVALLRIMLEAAKEEKDEQKQKGST